MSTQRRYCLITPCRDEAKFARQTLDSVTRQSLLPALWVIVDDGSSDETPQILAEYAAKYSWIRVLRREDRGQRAVGSGVIDAFYHGYDTINPDDFDYVCKLDLDLVLPEHYFQTLVEKMEQNPRLGTCSGKAYFKGPSGRLISEKLGDENAIGAAKFYRTICFKQIGGFQRFVMWDGIDGHRCRMLGWIAASWDEPELRILHLRPMGSSYKNWWTGRMKHGVGQYYMGTHPIYMLVSAAFRLTRPPYIIGGIAMFWGFIKSYLTHGKRYEDPEFRKFLRRYQMACLFKGKRRATAELNERQQTVWHPSDARATAV